ncbi:MAG: hypothetical protein RIS85_2379 [Pseudomonadota bacterium]
MAMTALTGKDDVAGKDHMAGSDHLAIEALLRDDLRHADQAVVHMAPILRHLLRNDDSAVFSDEVIARVRGMLADLERQLIRALGDAAGFARPSALQGGGDAGLADALSAQGRLLNHLHMLALEWQLTERLQARLGIDPVLTPLLQDFVASPDPDTAARGMNLLAAQARFGQAIRRMQMPLAELPDDLHELAIAVMLASVADDVVGTAAADEAALFLRRTRTAHTARIDLLRDALDACTEIPLPDKAGVALFLTAMATRSAIARDMAIMATTESQMARLQLLLASAGLERDGIVAVFAAFHPEMVLPVDVETLDPSRAAAMLAESHSGNGA